MKLYYMDADGMRQLQDCRISEVKMPCKEISDGGESNGYVFMILNKPANEYISPTFMPGGTSVTFGGERFVQMNLRDAFWSALLKTMKCNSPVFDVDEWHGKYAAGNK